MRFPFFKNPKIEVFVRYCFYSNASAHKNRFEGFSHEKCFENLMQTVNDEQVNCTFLLDTYFAKPKRLSANSFYQREQSFSHGSPSSAYTSSSELALASRRNSIEKTSVPLGTSNFQTVSEKHFVQKQNRFPVVEIAAGEEGKSFLSLLDHVISRKFSDETIIYFLEDDYLHRESWADVLLEGFSLNKGDYITLFDHKDKYDLNMYVGLSCRLFHTASCHWRTTPSTTNTYAMRMKTLKEDIEIHRKFSESQKITRHHEKFLALGEKKRILLSSIPGWSTHCEPEFASPCYDWSRFLREGAL